MLLPFILFFVGLVIALSALRISSGWIFGEARASAFWAYLDAANRFAIKLFIVGLGFLILAVFIGVLMGWL